MSASDELLTGELRVIFGPMFGGKTAKLTSELSVHEGIGHRILVINHAYDNRSETGEAQSSGILTSHQLTPSRLNHVEEISVSNLRDVPEENIKHAEVIGIDESQFFDDIELCIEWASKLGKVVYAAGLLATSENKMFGNFYKLLPYALIIKHRIAVCTICMKKLEQAGILGIRPPGNMTLCLSRTDSPIMVGSDKYISSCLTHWTEANEIGIETFIHKYKHLLELIEADKVKRSRKHE